VISHNKTRYISTIAQDKCGCFRRMQTYQPPPRYYQNP